MKIAIVGSAPSSTHLAPYDDHEWKIWGIGSWAASYKRVDLLFEIHDYMAEEVVGKDYHANLVKMNIPIVVSDDCPFEPNEKIVFPFDQAKELIDGTYLTSSIAYMMAYAILQGAKEIGIWGCDLAVDDNEYFYQRPCMEQWIGFAKGKGIRVTIPEVSSLGKSAFIYGKGFYGDPDTGIFSKNEFDKLADAHRGRIEEFKAQKALLDRQIDTHNGSVQAYERMAKVARAVSAGQDIKSLLHTAIIK